MAKAYIKEDRIKTKTKEITLSKEYKNWWYNLSDKNKLLFVVLGVILFVLLGWIIIRILIALLPFIAVGLLIYLFIKYKKKR